MYACLYANNHRQGRVVDIPCVLMQSVYFTGRNTFACFLLKSSDRKAINLQSLPKDNDEGTNEITEKGIYPTHEQIRGT